MCERVPMKVNIGLICAGLIIVMGFGLSITSFIPQVRYYKEPYWREEKVTTEEVKQDGTCSASRVYYSETFYLEKGDEITVRASTSDEEVYLNIIIEKSGGEAVREFYHTKDYTLKYTAEESAYYNVRVERWRSSTWVVYWDKTEAYVYVKTKITRTTYVQDYRTVPKTEYPYKDLLYPGVVIMILGIGAGVITGFLSLNKNIKQQAEN